MVEINRVWLNVDTDTNKITLFASRVSIRVDGQYICSCIEGAHRELRSSRAAQ